MAGEDFSKLPKYCVVCNKEFGAGLISHCTKYSVIAIKREGFLNKKTTYFSLDGRKLDENDIAKLRVTEKSRAAVQEREAVVKETNPPSVEPKTQEQKSTLQQEPAKSLPGKSMTRAALDKLWADHDIPGLISALDCDDREIRFIALQMLGKSGDERALDYIIEGTKDSDTRLVATIALINFNDQRIIEPVLAALDDSWGMVRRAGLNAIKIRGSLFDKRAISPAIKLMNDKDEHIREDAFNTLLGLGIAHDFFDHDLDIPQDEWVQLKVVNLVRIYKEVPSGFVTSGEGIHEFVIRNTGIEIDRRGGMELMLKAHSEFTRICQIAGAPRNLEMMWDGIGDWRG